MAICCKCQKTFQLTQPYLVGSAFSLRDAYRVTNKLRCSLCIAVGDLDILARRVLRAGRS